MGTKHIKKALVALKAKAHDDGDDGAWNLALEAEEVRALEHAAKALSANAVPNNKETGLALGLMDNIAREAL